MQNHPYFPALGLKACLRIWNTVICSRKPLDVPDSPGVVFVFVNGLSEIARAKSELHSLVRIHSRTRV